MTIEGLRSSPLLKKTLCFLLSGKAGVGKSYSASILKRLSDEERLKSETFNFATGVKNTARFMGWDSNKDAKGRALLQSIGQAGRAYKEDLWATDCFIRIENSVGFPFDCVFIDDWRFPNEAKFVSQEPLYKPITIRIESPEREILLGTPEYNDVSETSLDNYGFGYIIRNNEDCDLESELRRILMLEISKNV